MLGFLASQPGCTVAMEACGGAHHWGREIGRLGHSVQLIPPAYVKAYVKRQKNDAADAEAICEAASRPTMSFVAVKTVDQQARGMLFRTRDLLVRQRTQTINAPTDVTAFDELSIERTAETITETGLRESGARLVPAGSVLLTSRATIGFTAIAAVPMATNQGFANLICGDRLLPEYLAVWLRLQKDRLIQLAGGTTFKEISKSTLKKVEIPIPSIEKQREFAALVNRAYRAIGKAQTATDAAAALSASLMDRLLGR